MSAHWCRASVGGCSQFSSALHSEKHGGNGKSVGCVGACRRNRQTSLEIFSRKEVARNAYTGLHPYTQRGVTVLSGVWP